MICIYIYIYIYTHPGGCSFLSVELAIPLSFSFSTGDTSSTAAMPEMTSSGAGSRELLNKHEDVARFFQSLTCRLHDSILS